MWQKNKGYTVITLKAQHLWRLWTGVIIDLTNISKDIRIKIPATKEFSSLDEIVQDLGLGI